mmetsp:Transcript_38364/g.105677  ORF Transcript_38364/g.105677 Transcript_38364/m.105677 type:complete len:610 (+) Transcript_38364:53-1882(+)
MQDVVMRGHGSALLPCGLRALFTRGYRADLCDAETLHSLISEALSTRNSCVSPRGGHAPEVIGVGTTIVVGAVALVPTCMRRHRWHRACRARASRMCLAASQERGEPWLPGSQGCAASGCRCRVQRLRYPYKVSADYHLGHPAVSELARWRRAARQAPPAVYRTSSPCCWRSRAKLAVGPAAGDGGAIIGLFHEGTHEVVSVSGCAAHHPAIEAAVAELRSAIEALRGRVAVFDHERWRERGDALRYAQFTVERSSSRVQLVLVWNGARGPPSEALRRLLQQLWPAETHGGASSVPRATRIWHSIWVHWRDPDERSRRRAIFSERPDAWEQVRPAMSVGGAPAHVEEVLDGLALSFGPASFRQANLGVFEQVLRDMKVALRRLAPPSTLPGARQPRPLRLLELHGGVGAIGLSLAHAAHQWTGSSGVNLTSSDANPFCADLFAINVRQCLPGFVETGHGSLSRSGAAATGLMREWTGGNGSHDSVRFYALDDRIALRAASGRTAAPSDIGGPFDVIVMDPPRRGLARRELDCGLVGAGAVISEIRRCESVRGILYMSCGHESFMADADRLTSARGIGVPFELTAFVAYDMFPFTPHIESLGVFTRTVQD